jgi:PilZ domain
VIYEEQRQMSNSNVSLDAQERRNAPRYPVRTYAALQILNKNWDAHLLDISATGARFAILDEHPLNPGDEVILTIELEDISHNQSLPSSLQLHGKVVHAREHIIGLLLITDNPIENEKLHKLLAQFAEMKL